LGFAAAPHLSNTVSQVLARPSEWLELFKASRQRDAFFFVYRHTTKSAAFDNFIARCSNSSSHASTAGSTRHGNSPRASSPRRTFPGRRRVHIKNAATRTSKSFTVLRLRNTISRFMQKIERPCYGHYRISLCGLLKHSANKLLPSQITLRVRRFYLRHVRTRPKQHPEARFSQPLALRIASGEPFKVPGYILGAVGHACGKGAERWQFFQMNRTRSSALR
jgi:hypothetical protein